MRNLKTFKLFIESLQDDFDNSVKDLENKKDAEEFANALNNNEKQEFMYRLSDGEDLIDLIEEFVDKYNFSDENQFNFRALVMNNRLKDIKSKYDEGDRLAGTDLVMIAEKEGVDKTMNYLITQMDKNPHITPDRVIDLIQVSINWLQENDELINWTYQREQNANSEKIEAGKILIDRLREFSGDEYI